MRIASDQIRYQIIAQYRASVLVVAILGKDLYFMSSAKRIFNNPDLLSGFSQEEAALIGYIVGAEQSMDAES